MKAWFKESLEQKIDEAARHIGRYEGMKDAFKEVIDLMNPEKTCPICGWKTWRPDGMPEHMKFHPENER